MVKLGARQLRKTPPKEDEIKEIKRNPIYIVADRIIDTYNIGSLFRLADAIAAEKLFLCGDMEYPPSSKIHKSAVGTEEWVSWEKTDSAAETAEQLASQGVQIIAVEQHPTSIPYTLLPKRLKLPVAIVIGNETDGVSK